MSNVTAIPGLDIDPSDFWVTSGLIAKNETFDGLVDQVGSLLAGIGTSTTTFSEFKFNVGDLTYRYVGDWALKVVGTGLTATTSASGSYDTVIVEKAGEVIEQLDLTKALDVVFDDNTGVSILGINLSDLVNPILETLLGDGIDLDVGNLHLGVNPELENLVELEEKNPVSTGDPTDGPDTLIGTPKSDHINGLGGNDKIYGRGAADVLHGNAGNDMIWGQGGNDKIYGDAGNDLIWGKGGKSLIHGGTGNDKIYGQGAGDKLYGDAGNDTLYGNGGKDLLNGGAGNDKIYGGGNGDVLVGGSGKDLLVGGFGDEIMTGGKGADTFDFNLLGDSTTKGAVDLITDFSHKQHDKIDLSTIDANTKVSGNQSFDFLGKHQGFDGAGQLSFYQKGGDTYIQADTNGDGKAEFTIHLDHAINLQANDFIL